MKILKWMVRILLAAVIAGFAFLTVAGAYTFSDQDAGQSSALSGSVTELIGKGVSKLAEENEQFAILANKAKAFVAEYSPYGDDWDSNVRKLAHFSIYFLLGTLFYLILRILRVPPVSRWILSVAFCLILAVFDELHQGQVAGRAMSQSDVLLDTFGAFCASTLYLLTGRLFSWLNHI